MSPRYQIDAVDRRTRLLAYTPHAPAHESAAVQADVIDLVMSVTYRGWNSDHAMMAALYTYAINAARDYGHFDPATHLGELYIAAHENRHMRHLADHSIATLNASIRRIEKGTRMSIKRSRPHVAAPYTPQEWEAIVDAADTAGPWAADATLMVEMSGTLAMRASEISAATSSWVGRDEDRVWIDVPNEDGVLRRIHVFGRTAEILVNAAGVAGPNEFLLHPGRGDRRNTCSSVKTNITRRSPDFDNFQVRRARNTCIANWLNEPIPFMVIAVTADLISAQNHFVTDLACLMDQPDDSVVEAVLGVANGVVR